MLMINNPELEIDNVWVHYSLKKRKRWKLLEHYEGRKVKPLPYFDVPPRTWRGRINYQLRTEGMYCSARNPVLTRPRFSYFNKSTTPNRHTYTRQEVIQILKIPLENYVKKQQKRRVQATRELQQPVKERWHCFYERINVEAEKGATCRDVEKLPAEDAVLRVLIPTQGYGNQFCCKCFQTKIMKKTKGRMKDNLVLRGKNMKSRVFDDIMLI